MVPYFHKNSTVRSIERASEEQEGVSEYRHSAWCFIAPLRHVSARCGSYIACCGGGGGGLLILPDPFAQTDPPLFCLRCVVLICSQIPLFAV
jgi:hypothetical protein